METKVVPVGVGEQMKSAYIDYAMSVIVGRALPDVRDGFKPVHRRILYTMGDLNMHASGPYKKSARIVGEVLGKYHPHGDMAIYDAMARMAQDWNLRVPLIDGQGNYGSPDGDGPAAMRYTEARLAKVTELVLADLDKDTVDFQPNFDDSLKEPVVLPTRVPQLILNGSSGIAVGMATNMLPHNLGETIDACVAYVQNMQITAEELLQYLPAPDFPTGGIIYGMEGVREAMLTGRGTVVVRGKVHEEKLGNDKIALVIDEVPYQVNRDALTQKIADLVNEKRIEGISDIANQSSEDGTRILVELKRGVNPNVVLNLLYKNTALQSSFGVNNVALVRGIPRILSMRDLIAEFIGFRFEVIVRRTRFELRKAEERAHILEGYLKALAHLDAVVALIRASADANEARQKLMEQHELSEAQAKAILELRLQRLTNMERLKIKADYDSEQEKIARCKQILASEEEQKKLIVEELLQVKDKHSTVRRSEIQYNNDDFNVLDFIPKEDVVITISHDGYIKRTVASAFRQQRRGGRGMKGSAIAGGDWIEHLFVASTHHTLLFFTTKGRCHWLKVHILPESSRGGKGRSVQNLLQLEEGDSIRTVIDIPDFNDNDFVNRHSILLCTKKGIIKRTDLRAFSRPMVRGIIAIKVTEDDALLAAALANDESEILMAVKSGFMNRFQLKDNVRSVGRNSVGVRGMYVGAEDELIGMLVVNPKTENNILVVSDKGYGKCTPLEEYRLTVKRGGKGVKTINITEKTGLLVGILEVSTQDDLMITAKSGITIRTAVQTIRVTGRNSQGVRLINLAEGDSIAAIARVNAEIDAEEVEGEDAE